MNLNPFKASYRAYASLLTSDQNLRKKDFKAKLVGGGARLAAFAMSEIAIQWLFGAELGAGALTGPFAIIVEPLMGLLGIGEEIGGIAYISPKIAEWAGQKVDVWYDRTRADNKIIDVKSWESTPVPPPLPNSEPTPQTPPSHSDRRPPPLSPGSFPR